ncbi:MAG: AMP-binding protein [Ramlibacter sp.]
MNTGNNAVLVCCRAPDMFRRAHVWALNRGCTSVLVPQSDWPKAAAIAARFGARAVLTDEPDALPLPGCKVRDPSMLSQEAPAAPGAWPEPVAILFTSGSTGVPKAIAKDARAVLGEFAVLRDWFRSGPPMKTFVTTVPLEHMFGYTFAFWFPLLAEASLVERRVFAPSELRAACAAAKEPAWVITTPTHLRAYVHLPGGYDNVAGLVCATSPLGTELARAAARRFEAPITEIYGSTETGAVAARLRSADEQAAPPWTPLQGIRIAPTAAGLALCDIPHVDGPVELSDVIEVQGARFQIVGRTGDMLKIAGKRHSLSALNQLLASVPGVRDSVYFVPETGARPGMLRPTALVVLSDGFSREDVLGALRGQVDDVFLPRPLHVVDEIPRTSAGKVRGDDVQRMVRTGSAGLVSPGEAH